LSELIGDTRRNLLSDLADGTAGAAVVVRVRVQEEERLRAKVSPDGARGAPVQEGLTARIEGLGGTVALDGTWLQATIPV
jgi:hypothetical protein